MHVPRPLFQLRCFVIVLRGQCCLSTDEMQIELQIPAVWLLCHLPRLQAARGSSHRWPGIFSAFDIYKKVIEDLTPCWYGPLVASLRVPCGMVFKLLQHKFIKAFNSDMKDK